MNHSWVMTLEKAINEIELELFLRALQEKTTLHAGSLKQADKKIVCATVKKCLPDAVSLIGFLTQLVEWPQQLPITKQLMLHFIPEVYQDEPTYALEKLYTYANDENWEVRETAAWTIAEMIVVNYEQMIPVLSRWSKEGTPYLQRAIAVGIKVAAKQRVPHWIHDFLQILTPIMHTDDSYVKKNMGAFAIGDGVLRTYPEPTITWLETLGEQSDHPTVLFNIASVFTSAASRQYPEVMEKLLSKASKKNAEKSVQNAIVRACKKQAGYHPERVMNMLKGWDHPNQVPIVEKLARQKIK